MRAPASMLTEDKGSRRPVGTGPFVFSNWTPDVSFEATANPDYWVENQPYLDGSSSGWSPIRRVAWRAWRPATST